jgi:hypothetical protein
MEKQIFIKVLIYWERSNISFIRSWRHAVSLEHMLIMLQIVSIYFEHNNFLLLIKFFHNFQYFIQYLSIVH